MLDLFFLLFIIQTADPWFGGTVAGKSPSTPLDAFTAGKQTATFAEPRHSQKVTLVYSGTQEGIITKPAGERDEYLELRERQRQRLRHCHHISSWSSGQRWLRVFSGLVLLRSDNASPFEARAHFCWWSGEQTASNGLRYGWFSFTPQLHLSLCFLRAENVSSGIKWSWSDLPSSSPPLRAPSFILMFSLRIFIHLIPIFILFSPTNFAPPPLFFNLFSSLKAVYTVLSFSEKHRYGSLMPRGVAPFIIAQVMAPPLWPSNLTFEVESRLFYKSVEQRRRASNFQSAVPSHFNQPRPISLHKPLKIVGLIV